MRWGIGTVDHHGSYSHGQPVVRVDDTEQLHAAARELEALALHEQACHLAELHATLAELDQRDGVQVNDAELDAQADYLALLERGDRFLEDVATRLHPDGELLELARQVDDHGLGVWREAASSLVDDCPPSLAHLRWQVEEEQCAELRSHAHLMRREAQLSTQLRRLGLVGRWWRRRWVAELAGRLADCRARRERSARRLAHLDAKLRVIDNTEQARAAWITHAREVLIRGVAAAQVLAERQQQDDQRASAEGPSAAVRSWVGGRDRPQGTGVAVAGMTAHIPLPPRSRLSCRTCWRAAAATTAPPTPPRSAWHGGRCWSPASAPPAGSARPARSRAGRQTNPAGLSYSQEEGGGALARGSGRPRPGSRPQGKGISNRPAVPTQLTRRLRGQRVLANREGVHPHADCNRLAGPTTSRHPRPTCRASRGRPPPGRRRRLQPRPRQPAAPSTYPNRQPRPGSGLGGRWGAAGSYHRGLRPGGGRQDHPGPVRYRAGAAGRRDCLLHRHRARPGPGLGRHGRRGPGAAGGLPARTRRASPPSRRRADRLGVAGGAGVDSIAALVPRVELEGEMGERHAGVQANLLSQALRKLCGPIARAGTAVLVTNQLRQRAGTPGTPVYTSGGRALGYYASVRLDLRPLGPVRDGGRVVGSRVRVLVVKNKVAAAWQTAELEVRSDRGVLGEAGPEAASA